MLMRRRLWILGVCLLVIVSLEVVFQPLQRTPRPKDLEMYFASDRGDVKKLVKKGESFDEISGKLINDVVQSSGDKITVSSEASTREEARRLQNDYTDKLVKRFKWVHFERSNAEEFPPAPVKALGKLAYYQPTPHLKLGLDLQGGSHLVLQVRRALYEFKFEKPVGSTVEEKDAFLVKVRDLLEAKGYKDFGVQVKKDDPHLVDVSTQAKSRAEFDNDKERILKALQREYGNVKLVREEPYFDQKDILKRTVDVVRRRVDSLGVSEPLIQPQGDSQIIVELPGIDDPQKAIEMLGTTALLEFRKPPEKYKPQSDKRPGGKEVTTFVDKDGNVVPNSIVYNESEPILTGRSLKANSTVGMDPTEGAAVHFEFDREGQRLFGDFTRKNVGKYLGIFLDEEPVSCPVIRQPITGGQGQISGGFETTEEATDLKELLNAGALPVPTDIVENRTVSATLGTDSIRKSLTAGMIGLGLVVIFMIAMYRLPGILADVALGIYCVLVLAIMVVFNATLTLPGIAGFIMSIGISVDTNILIFERMKEEFRTDKTFKSAIQAGFSRAWTAILDSHVTTLLGCSVLFYYGTGPIKGFALVLGIGVLTSLFTANTISRLIIYTVADTGLAKVLPLWNAPRSRNVA
ncbi:MAG: protein translocase subunit SecD [Armatimonadetes bacterium]|nr:protein translocase subunit SecD [Armatimonadota bacterium]